MGISYSLLSPSTRRNTRKMMVPYYAPLFRTIAGVARVLLQMSLTILLLCSLLRLLLPWPSWMGHKEDK